MTIAPQNHRAHGLTIVSDVPLLDAHPVTAPAGPDGDVVTIALRRAASVGGETPPGELILDNQIAGRRWYVATRDDDVLRFRMPGLADFAISGDLTSVACHPDPELPPELLPVLVSGNVMAFVLALRGAGVLHASAVQVDGSAVAIAGPTNTGKSTFAALLCLLGTPLVTDDLLRIEAGRQLMVHRGGRELRLRPVADDLVVQFPAHHRRTTADGRHAVRPPTTASEQLPLEAVVTIRRSDAATPQIRRLTGASAMFALLRAPRTMGWCDPAQLRRHFDAMSRTVERISVYAVDLPRGTPLDARLASDVLTRLGEASSATVTTRVGLGER